MNTIVNLLLYRIPWYGIIFLMCAANYLYRLWIKRFFIESKKYIFLWCSFLIGSLYVILHFTLLYRSVSNVARLNLIPFSNLLNSNFDKSVVKTMTLNILLFYPLGLSMLAILQQVNFKRKVLLIIFWSFLLSSVIELVQFFAGIGDAEIDDIICNVFGAMFGVIADINCKKKGESLR